MPIMWCALIAMVLTAAPIETMHVKVATSVKDAATRRATLVVDVEPKPRMHVYAPGQPGFIVVSLTLEKDPAFTAAAPKFPKPEKIVFAPLNETQLVYAKPFRIVQDVTRTSRGPLTIKGTLRYQACDDTVCYRPTNVPLEWTVR
ncbi:MAG: hypothetical protein HOQ29_02310 [Acidobacteria bacterium]|nr:hypothetical protein [Acidobacteriota bacterium]